MCDTRSDPNKCLRCLASPIPVHRYKGKQVSVASDSRTAASRSLPPGWPHHRTPIQGERSELCVRYLGGDERGPTVGRPNLYIFPAPRHGAGSRKIEGETFGQGLASARWRPVRLRRLASPSTVKQYKGKQGSEVSDSKGAAQQVSAEWQDPNPYTHTRGCK